MAEMINLIDYCREITVGHVGPLADEYVSEGVPLLRSQNISTGRIQFSGLKFITRQKHESLGKSQLRPDDIAVVRTGLPGTAAVIPDGVGPLNCSDIVIVRPDTQRADPYWLAYYINSIAQSFVTAHTVGAVQQHFNVKSAKSLPVPKLDIAIQINQASILRALDLKIEANTKLAHTADELASALYLDAKSEVFGVKPFEQVAVIGGGGTPSTKEESFWNGSINWATPTDITGSSHPYLFRTARTITESGLLNCASPLYPPGTILMTSRATIGAFAIAQEETAVNQGFIAVQANEPEMQTWLYFDMKSRVDEFKQWANGATFLELSRKNFKQLPVAVPDSDTLAKFNAIVSPLLTAAISAVKEIQRLSELRDYLLPRLMSGKVTVKEAEESIL